jgi:Resolvase, N terminal domain
MKTVAYVRVSTDTQDVTHQRLAILEFARTERMAVDAFLEVQASSRRSGKVRQLDVLLGSLEPGDALIVSELSRLGRSVGEIITLVDRLMHHQVRVFALKEGSLNLSLFVEDQNGPSSGQNLPCELCWQPRGLRPHARSARPARTHSGSESSAGTERTRGIPAS